MDDQAFRRERMLASGLLREPSPAELAKLTRLMEGATALEATRGVESAAASRASLALASLPTRPSYRRPRAVIG
ncbi:MULTISPECIES: hypothetical protein [Roseomonadaceae]|uniref:Uncharacterized protein n=1 Tax=Falsiroseomonas oleicola TaxID=2801474 RepID=A0ABS6H873_9PROT|nr:hypothetical protein [Roseomonas oleicola]MBU8543908.1 hypothetical protein [Roseomonas oleicola]